MKRLVAVEHCLDPVLSWRNVRDAVDGVAEDVAIEDSVFSGRQAFHVDPEQELGILTVLDLEPRLLGIVRRDHQQQTPVQGRARPLVGKRNGKAKSGGLAGHGEEKRQDRRPSHHRL